MLLLPIPNKVWLRVIR